MWGQSEYCRSGHTCDNANTAGSLVDIHGKLEDAEVNVDSCFTIPTTRYGTLGEKLSLLFVWARENKRISYYGSGEQHKRSGLCRGVVSGHLGLP